MPGLTPILDAALTASIRAGGRVFGGAYGDLPPGPPSWPEEHVVTLGERRHHFLTWGGDTWGGDVPPLLLLHGLNNSAWVWARLAPLLSHRRRVVALSQRGHGGSSPGEDYRLESTTADILAFMDHMGLESADVCGHSWGGKVAIHLAAAAPDRVERLLLADPAPPGPLNPVILRSPGLFQAAFVRERRSYPTREALLDGARRVPWILHGDEVDRRVWEGMHAHRGGVWRPHLGDDCFLAIIRAVLAADITPMLQNLSAPVLLMRPTYTVSFLPGEWRGFRRIVPRFREARLSGDHAFIYTNPVDTARVVGELLEQAPLPGGR